MSRKQTIAFTGNRLLNAFDSVSRERILPYLEGINAARGDILCEAGSILNHAHFPDGAVVALLTVLRDGSAIETLNIGREGAYGILWGFHKRESFTRAIVRLPGPLLRIRTEILRKEVERSEHLYRVFFRYSGAQAVHMQQKLACNALHTTRQRFCRWLLTMNDKWDGRYLPCTHELLAEALGAHRKSVTLAAQKLQKEGLISYNRGRIQVLDRPGLEKASCECYAVIKDRFEAYFAPLAQST